MNEEKKQKNFNAQVDKRASNPLVLGKIKKDSKLAKSFHFKDNYFNHEGASPGNDQNNGGHQAHNSLKLAVDEPLNRNTDDITRPLLASNQALMNEDETPRPEGQDQNEFDRMERNNRSQSHYSPQTSDYIGGTIDKDDPRYPSLKN